MSMINPRRNGFVPSFDGMAGIRVAVVANAPSGALVDFARVAPRRATVAARAPPEDCRNFRRFNLFIMPNRKVQGECNSRRGLLTLLDLNVLPTHLHTSSGVNLQRDYAFGEFWRGIAIVDHLDAIQTSNDVRTLDGDFKLFPFPRFESFFSFGWRLRSPPPPAAFV